MNVDRTKLENYLSNKFLNIILGKKYDEIKIYNYAYDKYNMPKGDFSDFVAGRKAIQEANDFALFIMLDSVINNKCSTKKLSEYFTDREIEQYGASKIKEETKVEFPLLFPMIKVAADQWIGSIDVNMFCNLQNNGLINYNPETQRAMTRITRKDSSMYKITLNKTAVNEITNDFIENIYIPDTITLNIPADDEYADFYYDEDHCQIVINSLKTFDINDGYHRYVSMFRAKAINPEFNYPMELRITNFDTQKSQRMIYQMDQKTKMTKAVSDTYNVYAPQNKVVQRINENSMCNICGFISRDEGKINYALLAECIGHLYFAKKRNINTPETRKEIIRVSKELIEDFNILTETDEKYLDKKYSSEEIVALSVVFYYYDGKDKMTMINAFHSIMDHSEELIAKYIGSRMSRSFKSSSQKMMNFIKENFNV